MIQGQFGLQSDRQSMIWWTDAWLDYICSVSLCFCVCVSSPCLSIHKCLSAVWTCCFSLSRVRSCLCCWTTPFSSFWFLQNIFTLGFTHTRILSLSPSKKYHQKKNKWTIYQFIINRWLPTTTSFLTAVLFLLQFVFWFFLLNRGISPTYILIFKLCCGGQIILHTIL